MPSAARDPKPALARNVLAIDIGGTGLKAAVVDRDGKLLTDRVRIDTPADVHPDAFVEVLANLCAPLPAYDRIAIGFPGMVRHDCVLTAPLLPHPAWAGYPLAERLGARLGKPARLGNDADVAGFAVIEGKGLEMVVTLGTGFGSALYEDGRLCPHLELAHAPFRKGETYNEQIGEAARKVIGNTKWQKRVRKMIDNMRTLTTFDHLYIGGGNSRRVEGELPADVTLVDNQAGISGGAWLWRE